MFFIIILNRESSDNSTGTRGYVEEKSSPISSKTINKGIFQILLSIKCEREIRFDSVRKITSGVESSIQ